MYQSVIYFFLKRKHKISYGGHMVQYELHIAGCHIAYFLLTTTTANIILLVSEQHKCIIICSSNRTGLYFLFASSSPSQKELKHGEKFISLVSSYTIFPCFSSQCTLHDRKKWGFEWTIFQKCTTQHKPRWGYKTNVRKKARNEIQR